MNGLVEKLILIVLGWLLGLLAPIIVELVRTRRALRSMEGALAIELDELQIRLADAVFHIANHLGVFDHGLIRWLLASYQTYQGLYADPETVEILLEATRRDDAYLTVMNEQRTHGTGQILLPRTFAAPVLESAMALLPLSVARFSRS